jgi:hypothetical protein
MGNGAYRRWCPPESPICVELSTELLLELRPEAESTETTGFLYGLRQGNEVRVLAVRSEDLALEKVGIFVSRLRGEVFLTESNLGLFENEKALLALVIAGDKAGFFVREPDGSIQSVSSHQEFPVPNRMSVAPKKWKWAWPVAVTLALAILLPVFPRPPARALALRVWSDRTELHIAWQPGENAILEIVDGGERISIPVRPDQANATYARRTSDVEIGLIPVDGRPARRESARFAGPALPVGEVYSEFASGRAEVDRLRSQVEAKRARADSLQKAIGYLLAERAIQQQ